MNECEITKIKIHGVVVLSSGEKIMLRSDSHLIHSVIGSLVQG